MTRAAHQLRSLLMLLATLGAAACADSSARDNATTPDRPPVAVTVSPAVASELIETIDVIGSLSPKFFADVKSEVTGTVTAVHVTQWVPVERGAPLAQLDASEAEATVEALRAAEGQARTGEARARREYERAQQLQQYGLITPQALDDARTAVDAAEALTSAARAQVRAAEAHLSKAFIRSPMNGVVALRGVSVGDRVENMGGNGPMFRIVDNRLLELTVSIPSSRLALVRVGQTIDFESDASPGRTFTGTVMFINPSIEEDTRSAKVVAEVRNADGVLKGGAFVRGRLVLARRAGVLQLPREALLNWDPTEGRGDVFVVEGDRATAHHVVTGAANGRLVEIVSGIRAGDRVVTRGAFSLRTGDRVAAAEEGA
ncbi:MAG: efflux RND transporter periplasmic adaptor subunit [Vicinamibacterales bacterium]